MRKDELDALLAVALRGARSGAALVLDGFRKKKTTHHKGATDLVTDYDRACEELLRDFLARETGLPVMGEEFGGASANEGVRWIVDPIDGTTNYVHGHPFFCVSIGLADGTKPLLGVVHAPALALEWTAIVGGALFRNGEMAAVSATASFGDSLLATGFPYDRADAHPDFVLFERIKCRCQAVRRCGSAAIDLALVADGTYDGYWERKVNAWDVAGGVPLVLAGGGMLARFDGSSFDVSSGSIVATNAGIQSALLGEIAASRTAST